VSTTSDVLLARLIDDAGQFPPARKPLEDALRDHRAARSSPHGWMLGRFLCPASKLEDATLPRPLGVVADGDDWEMDLDAAVTLGADAFELRDPGPESYPVLSAAPVDVFVEGAEDFEALHAHQLGGKIRCGGLTADAFPSDETVAKFIAGCKRWGVAFKATAGLHHPFRQRDKEIGVLQHGFINLLAATALDGFAPAAVIAEDDPAAFSVGADELRWRDHRANREQVEEARGTFTAFGSCSFTEPVEDLVAYGVLRAG
jgi:hypothetical protein